MEKKFDLLKEKCKCPFCKKEHNTQALVTLSLSSFIGFDNGSIVMETGCSNCFQEFKIYFKICETYQKDWVMEKENFFIKNYVTCPHCRMDIQAIGALKYGNVSYVNESNNLLFITGKCTECKENFTITIRADLVEAYRVGRQ